MKGKNKPSRHHRRPVSLGGDDSPENISIVERDLHRYWHGLFANKTPEEICQVINKTWLDPNWKLICVESDKYSMMQKIIKQLT